MKGFVKGVLNRPVTAVVSVIALVLFSLLSLSNITMKLMPDMSMPMLFVSVTYAGASPEEVDELVVDKISDACDSISGLKSTTATANENYGYLQLTFEYGTDMDEAYDDVKSAIDGIKGSLPDDAGTPTIMELDMDSMADITLSISGTNDDINVLQAVKENIEPELTKVSEVAQVEISGGDEKYISVRLIPEYAQQYGLGITDIANAISAVNFTMPAGSVTAGDQKLSLNAEVKYKSIEELEQVPITVNGEVIHLSDVAKIGYQTKDASSISRYNGHESVNVSIKKKQSESAVTLSRGVKKALTRIEKNNPNLIIETVDDAADTILERLTQVGQTVLQAVLLAMGVLFVFFGDLKGSLIVGSSMPVSLMVTLICMYFAGFDLNVITLSSLVIAVGMMTDNAVVVLEMCFRKRSDGLSFRDAALEGTSIVMNSVIASTITTVVVYLPLSVMQGLSGQMFKQLGFTIIFALMASLISAITLIPLCFMIYRPVEKKDIITNRILKWVSRRYEKVLRFVLKWRKLTFIGSIILLVVSLSLSAFLQTELMASTDEGIVSIKVEFKPNVKLEVMDEVVLQLEQYLADDPDIDTYTSDTSESSASLTAYKADDSKKSTQEIVDEYNTKLSNISNICEVSASAGSSMGMSGFTNADSKEFDIASTDRDKLKAAAAEIVDIMHNTKGVLRVSNSIQETGTKAKVVIDPVMAQSKGFSAQQIAGLIYNNMSGKKAIEVSVDNETYDVTVEYPKDFYENVADLEAMTFTNSQGVSVPLSEIGSVVFASAPQSITREDGQYRATITATMTSTTKDAVSQALDQTVGTKEFDGVTFETSSMMEMQNEEFAALGQAIGIAVFLVFMVMAIQFESIADSVLIMLCLPFAAIGSILFLLVMNIKVSMVALMGILMLAGIVVNNGIILIDMAKQNQAAGMETVEALVDSGTGRMRPILMTTLTTMLAMIPQAFGIAKGAESMQAMSAVIVGGLISSTLLTLLLLPTFYLLLDRVRAKAARVQKKHREKMQAKTLSREEMQKRKLKEREAKYEAKIAEKKRKHHKKDDNSEWTDDNK
ncbi:Multidrug efflux pump subunit AcrB [Lachnospiraceae bacterium]|nr:Multidrug efflux pump subunit AcrB [Lachnospiraceae bacterium]